jgi:hypothetical protein
MARPEALRLLRIARLLLPVPSPPSLFSTATTTNPKISTWIAQDGD